MKRKVYQGKPKNLTQEDCDKLAEESEKYRNAIKERLDRLDMITIEDLQIRVK